MIKVGDLVTRQSYNNDMVFKVIDIIDDEYILRGEDIRLIADSFIDDLLIHDNSKISDDERKFIDSIKEFTQLDRSDYFYLPGKILHIDADDDYLNRCLKFYEENNLIAIGIKEKEFNIKDKIIELLNEYNPNIVVITGHDAYYKKKGNITDLEAYRNSSNFIEAVKEARKYESSHEKLYIIAGACQSNYEELIKAGANFASSPKRINIHALDPAIIASKLSTSAITKDIDLKGILDKTKYGTNGVGGLLTKGTMYIGYPR